MLAQVRIVLIGTTHPGNIGASARAMKTMGLERLCLVRPERYPAAEATARASGADDVLAAARICGALDEALEGCIAVYGASARRRKLPLPELDPRAFAAHALERARHGPVAVLFGREHSGLSNEELDRCHHLVHIPANPAYASLNLAAAVQILGYELRMAQRPGAAPDAVPEAVPIATAEDLERFYAHLQEVLASIDFLDPGNPRHLMRRLRRLYNRAQPDTTEINILRGILTAVQRMQRRG